jgi:uncharacterized membrane protein SpoIIM required for sporulation
MVLESLLTPLRAEKRPWEMLLWGFLCTSVAIALAHFTFEAYSSLIMVFFTVLACVPIVFSTVKIEEEKDMTLDSERSILKEHSKAIWALFMLFAGMTIAFSFWYTVLPADTVMSMFSVQTETIANINAKVTGNAISQGFSDLGRIFLNNIKVLVFCIFFSFLYGSGAIFILAWNASVIGTAMGGVIRSVISNYATSEGFAKLAGIFHASLYGFFRFSIHGIPEIVAYVVGGLAGGIISVAIVNHDFGTKKFEKIILDSSDLIILAILILVIAAIIEVYVTPSFISILAP